ncbi:hypothetical protein ACX27_00505 [Nostoc piscinale CENA21]|uniref:Methyltransferase domain-containing protein n=2 Tax=Nostoc TaxID=1177 RepID=A0A0M3V4B6_9NOSO|nr:hypothetical protein ACX27_00505 [Nostoc piscinale CENA21]
MLINFFKGITNMHDKQYFQFKKYEFLSVLSNEESRLYYDSLANVYDQLYNDGISLAENSIIRDMLCKYLYKGCKVLDLGCGSGLAYELISDFLDTNFNYTGVDISYNMLQQAQIKYSGFNNVDFYQINMEDLSYFNTNTFDAVISLYGSFSHSLKYKQSINEIKRVLKPNGIIFIMVYSRFSLRNIFRCMTKFTISSLSEIQLYQIRKTRGDIFFLCPFLYRQKY